MKFLKVLILSLSLFLVSNNSFSQCFQIESILVDACDNGSDEAYNEMFRMKIGPAPLNTSSLSINWPAQAWLNLVQNATTASKVSQLNTAIAAAGGCGQILEPTGGVLPANATVIVVTSPNLDTTLNSFGALTSDIYMLFQNTPSNPNAGHFGNYNATPATRTLSVSFGGGCTDSVTYQRANLVNSVGGVGGSISDLNGSTVNFTPSGTASYVNNGCIAPVPPFTVEAGTTPIASCAGQTINLSGATQGQSSVTWSAASGSFSTPNNLSTSYTIPTTATAGSSITLTLSATNSCGTTITDQITINISGSTLTLDSANNNQDICSGNAIAPIQYTFGGGATGATVTGLPTGVTATTSGNTVTISGTPTSPFSYNVNTIGGCGTVPPLVGSITFSTNATLTLDSANNNQDICSSNAIAPIQYTFGGGATGATVTGLPTGVTATTSGNTVTISGTPTSPFSYNVNTIGGCGTVPPLVGSITFSTNATLTLDSANNNQDICSGNAIAPIQYTFGGGTTNLNVIGLPTGVTATTSGNTVTISGTSTSGFSYSINTVGGCGTITLNGTISLSSNATLTLDSANNNQNICSGNAITPIQYTFGGGASSVNVIGLPTGVTATTSGNTVTISGTPASPFSYSVNTIGGCGAVPLGGSITFSASGITPTFNSITPICEGTSNSSLPTTSTNGITGIWSPNFNNTTTQTYTFTPNPGQCASSTSLTVQINPKPILTYTVTNTICDGNPLDFVLSSNVPGTTYTWSATLSNITGTYVTSGNESNINQIATLDNSETVGNVTVKITPHANGCSGDESNPITIFVNPNPVVDAVAVADTSVCSATNGANNVLVEISGNISGITYNWTAFTNGVTVVGGTTSGTITATSTTASFDLQVITSDPLVAGTIYFDVSTVRNGCPGNTLQSLVVTVNPNPGTAIPSPDKTICSGESTDLMIDVSPLIAGTEIEWEVLTVFNVTGANPGSGIAPQPISDILTSAQGGYVIYRVRTSLGECEGSYTDYRVNVNPAPLPILTDGNICITAAGEVYQTYTLNTGLNDVDYDFEWFDSTGTIIPGETNATLVVDEAGTYSVIATNWLTGCSSDPLLPSATATVSETMPATSMIVVQSEYFSDNATITVTVPDGTGTIMYSLDEGPLQSSNVFTGVSAGEHLVTVIDTEGCTFMTQTVTIIDYPNYFTPNGDGINDTWNISGLNQADAKLYIFDRYGKLIKQLSATDDSEGWDGTYNQELLPSTDYWFSLDYTENGVAKQFKAHFAMKR